MIINIDRIAVGTFITISNHGAKTKFRYVNIIVLSFTRVIIVRIAQKTNINVCD